jgi:hypothetical protein
MLKIYLNALAHVYDPHTDYLGQEEMESLNIAMNLSLFGIGASLENDDGYCRVRQLVPGGPAARSGQLKPGDRVVAIAAFVGAFGRRGLAAASRTRYRRLFLLDALLLAGLPEAEVRSSLPAALVRMCAEVEARAAELCPELCPAVPELLAELKALDKIVGVTSGHLERIGWAKLKAAGIAQYFSFGSFSDRNAHRSEIFRWGAQQAQLDAPGGGDHSRRHSSSIGGGRPVAASTCRPVAATDVGRPPPHDARWAPADRCGPGGCRPLVRHRARAQRDSAGGDNRPSRSAAYGWGRA